MNNWKINVDTETPKTQHEWQDKNDIQRILILEKAINELSVFKNEITFLHADKDGQVTVCLKNQLNAGERGDILMDLEEFLKLKVDIGITVWLEPLKDKSSLRKLRGIVIKEDK
ncbi:hypothetical protein PHIN8_03050 [Polynucleobacter sp. HIN8]|uniref:hypothetical protein n=1 Tax=Polynucleobacter sp. HIN8 TaxID=3047867 RepID=UPI0025729F24|nr:hypothetical protein [Polynucleobacter sp. HIN8]BEI38361.1 hypothetical protein PHIN8_03050 [Polynucleobacter sp. HIN8]